MAISTTECGTADLWCRQLTPHLAADSVQGFLETLCSRAWCEQQRDTHHASELVQCSRQQRRQLLATGGCHCQGHTQVCDQGVQGSSPMAAGLSRIQDAGPAQVRRQQLQSDAKIGVVLVHVHSKIHRWSSHTHPEKLWQQILHPALLLETRGSLGLPTHAWMQVQSL